MIMIYLVYCKVSGKIYIGKHKIRSTDTLDPWYLGSGKLLFREIERYGRENFQRIVLEYCQDEHTASQREVFWVQKYAPELNILIGGQTFDWTEKYKKEHPEEFAAHEKNRSKRLSGKNHPMYGKKMSSIQKEKLRRSHIGNPPWNKGLKTGPLSEAHREKISKANKGKKKPPFSKKHRENISKASMGRVPWNKGKKMPPPPNKGKFKYPFKEIIDEILAGAKYEAVQERYGIKSLSTITAYKHIYEKDTQNNYRIEKYGGPDAE